MSSRVGDTRAEYLVLGLRTCVALHYLHGSDSTTEADVRIMASSINVASRRRLANLARATSSAWRCNDGDDNLNRETPPLRVLSAPEISEFHERGFVVVRGLIPRPMVDVLRKGYDAVTRGEVESMPLRERIASDPEGEPLMQQLGGPYRNIDGWSEVGYLERLVAIGKQLMGEDIEYSYDQLIYKPPGSTVELLYHQDAGYGWPGKASTRGMTCWLALSEAVEEQGSLRFVP